MYPFFFRSKPPSRRTKSLRRRVAYSAVSNKVCRRSSPSLEPPVSNLPPKLLRVHSCREVLRKLPLNSQILGRRKLQSHPRQLKFWITLLMRRSFRSPRIKKKRRRRKQFRFSNRRKRSRRRPSSRYQFMLRSLCPALE